MRVTGGEAGEMPEGPLEKRMQDIEEKTEARRHGMSEKLDDIAEKVDQTGEELAYRAEKWEEDIVHAFSGVIRSGSDYIQNLDVEKKLDRAVTSIRKDPAKAMIIALGIGALLGFMLRRR